MYPGIFSAGRSFAPCCNLGPRFAARPELSAKRASDGDAALVNPRRRSLRVGLHHLRCWPAGNGRRNCAAAS